LSTGAAWVYTRNGSVWSQQGNKLVGAGAVGTANQGASVALSVDGNTGVVGGPSDNSGAGAAWVYTRSNGVWTQQGDKLVGAGAVGPDVVQGSSVALSADGNTTVLGGPGDNPGPSGTGLAIGAVWVYIRNGGAWSQQGNKLVGGGAVGYANQGFSVAVSADSNTTILGGPNDGSLVGAAWVFVRANPTNTHDFNGDGYSDIAWGDSSGDIAFWLMNGATVLSNGGIGGVPGPSSASGTSTAMARPTCCGVTPAATSRCGS
jgi:hypothetical protein